MDENGMEKKEHILKSRRGFVGDPIGQSNGELVQPRQLLIDPQTSVLQGGTAGVSLLWPLTIGCAAWLPQMRAGTLLAGTLSLMQCQPGGESPGSVELEQKVSHNMHTNSAVSTHVPCTSWILRPPSKFLQGKSHPTNGKPVSTQRRN